MSLNSFESRESAEPVQLPGDLSALLSNYRSAVPDSEGSTGFTPGIWAKIESRRRESRWFGRMARGFVTASGVICLLLSAAIWIPRGSASTSTATTYVEVLANDSGVDDVVDAELVHSESI